MLDLRVGQPAGRSGRYQFQRPSGVEAGTRTAEGRTMLGPSHPRALSDGSGEPACLVDLVRGGDQADVAEGLREVAELVTRRGVDLLGEQAEVVGVPGELVVLKR